MPLSGVRVRLSPCDHWPKLLVHPINYMSWWFELNQFMGQRYGLCAIDRFLGLNFSFSAYSFVVQTNNFSYFSKDHSGWLVMELGWTLIWETIWIPSLFFRRPLTTHFVPMMLTSVGPYTKQPSTIGWRKKNLNQKGGLTRRQPKDKLNWVNGNSGPYLSKPAYWLDQKERFNETGPLDKMQLESSMETRNSWRIWSFWCER